MNNLSQKIIDKIKQEGIEPTPKWEFVLKDTFFWVAFIISVVVGGLSFSIIFNTLLNNDWDLYMQLSGGLAKFIVITLPYFWLILFAVFIVIAYINIKNTKKAYKHSLQMIIGGVLCSSFLLGITFYNIGLASSLNKGLINKLPKYGPILNPGEELWKRPEGGFLSGKIESLEEDVLKLKDQNGEIWEVLLSDDILELVPNFVFREGSKIKIMGTEIKENCLTKCFFAEMLRPFDSPRMMLKEGLLEKEIIEEMNLHMRKIKPMMEGRMNRVFEN
ncbi:hypothetical protein KJ603_00570 [Patescibacteria group bacterium]|nr:hypothetical protein [Patescibacteria group bacterium]